MLSVLKFHGLKINVSDSPFQARSATLVINLIKKTNITCIYELMSYWDKEKKQARNKRICVGKIDSNGVFIPSDHLKPEPPVVTSFPEKIVLRLFPEVQYFTRLSSLSFSLNKYVTLWH